MYLARGAQLLPDRASTWLERLGCLSDHTYDFAGTSRKICEASAVANGFWRAAAFRKALLAVMRVWIAILFPGFWGCVLAPYLLYNIR